MTTNNPVYFTDGHGVSVSHSSLKVRDEEYPLDGIFSQKIAIVPPHRAPSTILMGTGILIFISGALNFLPTSLNGSIALLGFNVVVNAIIMVFGIAVLLTAIYVLFHTHEKYQVKVSTAKGEKTVLESSTREYANQIIDALNHAHLDLLNSTIRKRR